MSRGCSKTTVSCLSTLGIIPLLLCTLQGGHYIWNSFYGAPQGTHFSSLRRTMGISCFPELGKPIGETRLFLFPFLSLVGLLLSEFLRFCVFPGSEMRNNRYIAKYRLDTVSFC